MKQLFAVFALFVLIGVAACGEDRQPPAEQEKDTKAAAATPVPAAQGEKNYGSTKRIFD